MQEYPKWIRYPGKPDVLVDNAAAEASQLNAWAAEAPHQHRPNALLSQLDHDKDGRPGGSLKPAGVDLPALRAAYKKKYGKRPFGGWDADELTKRIEADA